MRNGIIVKNLFVFVSLSLLLSPVNAWSHHGGVSLAFGPGSPIETCSPLTLPEGGFVAGVRLEQVEWNKYDFAQPNNKSSFTFLSANMSYGFTPAFMGTVIVPYYIKRQDGFGENEGLADVKLQATYGFHYDPGIGFSRNRSEDTTVTLEGKKRIYMAVSFMMSLPTGSYHKELGGEIDPAMQPGFGAPSYTLNVSAARAFGSFTLNGDLGADFFTARENFQFGTELRANLAGVYELYGNTSSFLSKLDGILELNFLHLERDQENGVGVVASGGNILYLSPGMRFSFPSLQNANLGLLLKIPVWKDLNEQDQQQGSEGLEKYRLIVTLSFFF
ncbi:MAG TPA: hypothetical protein VMT12_14720 [Syntrophales bacterium]|nr:hypothetical protein [Syntrophales bacterium]